MVETEATRLAPDESAALGRKARATVPRSSHAGLPSDPDRPDPVTLLQSQAKTRVPELVPIRYGRMMASPFAFFRGAALGMAADLAGTPVSGITVQACGDAHLLNFGLYASPERRLVFDVNDFDETLPGPWEWDVKRLAASRLTSHSHGPGRVSSKSLTSNTRRRSAEPNRPKLDRCASPQACTASPDTGVPARSLAIGRAAPR